ncbi:MAG: pyruvate carboxylase, partial [Planctomycetia bacterium 21-64-5]
LYEQARAIGLGARWHEICRMYADVNQLFGDIVKVTPSSKAVGDMALFLIANNLTVDDVLKSDRELSFPESVVDLLAGRMGQPPGGFPPEVQKRVLRGQTPVEGRPGASLPPADFAQTAAELKKRLGCGPSRRDVVSYLVYPRVVSDFIAHEENYGDTSILPTPVFFYGPQPGEEMSVEIEPGKTLITKFLTIGDAQPDGRRTVFFELNGQPRDVTVEDLTLEEAVSRRMKADASNPAQVGAPMPGMVVNVAIKVGDKVAQGQKLLTMEAMKMETTIYAERDGQVAEVLVSPGSQVDAGDLVLRWE